MDTGDFVWNAVQQYQIHELGKETQETQKQVDHELGARQTDIRTLQARIDKLVLV